MAHADEPNLLFPGGLDIGPNRLGFRIPGMGKGRCPRDQDDVIAVLVEAADGQEGVFRRAALVETGDDVDDFDFIACVDSYQA